MEFVLPPKNENLLWESSIQHMKDIFLRLSAHKQYLEGTWIRLFNIGVYNLGRDLLC